MPAIGYNVFIPYPLVFTMRPHVMKKTPVVVRLDAGSKARLDDLAGRENRSRSNLMEKIIRDYLDTHGAPAPAPYIYEDDDEGI